ncbi:MAG: hypothetical protein CMP81_12780 [Fulvimarina sp.]|nr:hypothetical protein [Fulvimarina sp.]
MVAGVILALASNYAWGYFFGFPFLYCWMGPVVWGIYNSFIAAIGGFLIVIGLLSLILGRVKWLAIALTALFIGYLIPAVITPVFYPGGSCLG